MKSTHRTQWSLVPCAKAGAQRAARIPPIPPATAAAAPAVLMKARRPTRIALMRPASFGAARDPSFRAG
jgi:hypothetical protein